MKRLKILGGIVATAMAVIVVRLFVIQVIQHDEWVAKADETQVMLKTIEAKRGEIYFSDGSGVAAAVLNRTVYSVVVDPEVSDLDGVKNVLDKYASDYVTVDILSLKNSGIRYRVVAKGIPKEKAEQLAGENVSGMWFKEGTERVYPEGTLGATVLGFVNEEGEGQYGVEQALNTELSGEDGELKTVKDVNNVALSVGKDNYRKEPVDGKNIALTIDRGMQAGVEEIVANVVSSGKAQHAAAVVMDPETSEVLAMVSEPSYDPANYENVTDASQFINYTTEVAYEPASICKSFIFSAAINEGKMTADSTYYNTGSTVVDGWTISNAEQRSSLVGNITMKTALYWSLNTGSIQALRFLGGDPSQITQAGREKMYEYYHDRFRLGEPTGIELIEAEGLIQDPDEGDGRDSVYANMTFGQNIYLTMIQTATAWSAVVNGGTWRTPTIVRGTVDTEGNLTETRNEEAIAEQVIEESTSATMREMFINNRNYKKRAGIDPAGYDVGGKSGTAQVVVNGAYGDVTGETIGSYIGFGTTEGEMPKYVIMVKMWGDGQHIEGGDAQYLFDDLSNFVLNYMEIPPKS